MNFKWLPNALTIARCVFAGFVLVGFWQAMRLSPLPNGLDADAVSRQITLQQLWFQFAFLAFLAGAITDFLDGWLARKLDAHSRFGVWLDPIADKLLIAAALLAAFISHASLRLGARDSFTSTCLTYRGACIASKPAPTRLIRVINLPTAATVHWHALRTVAATLPAYAPGPHRPGSAHTA